MNPYAQELCATRGREKQAAETYLAINDIIMKNAGIFGRAVKAITGGSTSSWRNTFAPGPRQGVVSKALAARLGDFFKLPLAVFSCETPFNEEHRAAITEKIKTEFGNMERRTGKKAIVRKPAEKKDVLKNGVVKAAAKKAKNKKAGGKKLTVKKITITKKVRSKKTNKKDAELKKSPKTPANPVADKKTRRPGRPAKITAKPSTSGTEIGLKKRGPGRPRKSALKAVAGANAIVQKRKPGRPPKNSKPAVLAISTPKRKPGRPRKNSVVDLFALPISMKKHGRPPKKGAEKAKRGTVKKETSGRTAAKLKAMLDMPEMTAGIYFSESAEELKAVKLQLAKLLALADNKLGLLEAAREIKALRK